MPLLIDLEKEITTQEGRKKIIIQSKIEEGEKIALSGDSGVGKTTLLRMLAGFLKPDQGIVQWNGQTWFDSAKKINLPPQKRNIGFVFQEDCLFPHMDIYENLAFALKKEQRFRVDEFLEMIELSNIAHHKPHQLSGGQKQKVALARAFIRRPDLILMDEPLNSLDMKMREKLQNLILFFQQEFNTTYILVSHELAEIKKLSQRILILEDGFLREQKLEG